MATITANPLSALSSVSKIFLASFGSNPFFAQNASLVIFPLARSKKLVNSLPRNSFTSSLLIVSGLGGCPSSACCLAIYILISASEPVGMALTTSLACLTLAAYPPSWMTWLTLFRSSFERHFSNVKKYCAARMPMIVNRAAKPPSSLLPSPLPNTCASHPVNPPTPRARTYLSMKNGPVILKMAK